MKNDNSTFGAIAWWLTLLVAVLAVPAFAVIATSIISMEGDLAGIVVFVLACWLCTYLGMRLMSNPKFMDKINKK